MFTYKGYTIDGHTVRFAYELRHGEEVFSFNETLTFPAEANLPQVPKPAFETLSLILGVSYWKLFCPKDLRLGEITLDKAQAEFWNVVYTKGLGEFFYKNNIDFRGLVKFPFSTTQNSKLPLLTKERVGERRNLVLWGGGKDSIVTAELLKKDGREFDLFALGGSDIQRDTAAIAGKKLLTVTRQIDPLLLELNKRPDVYNGHVPVTFIYSMTALILALAGGYDAVVTSCEASANYGNVEYLGEEINHQWSKSIEFEKMFGHYIAAYITPKVHYGSLIRKYHEIEVAELFCQFPRYFKSFSSCNKNFALIKKEGSPRWCGDCPKCAFVFALLTAYLPKEEVVAIFGKNLFSDPSLISTYRRLLGVEPIKPFDCVGTPQETWEAFLLARQKSGYQGDVVMEDFLQTHEN